jgi:hypothetical protein
MKFSINEDISMLHPERGGHFISAEGSKTDRSVRSERIVSACHANTVIFYEN